ncbi:MAG: hypothetical protein ACNA8W_05830 [Bradymonadaceae bacterium]
MQQIFPVTVVIVITALVVMFLQHLFPSRDRVYVWGCYLAHVVAAFTLITVSKAVYGRTDMSVYFEQGVMLAEYLSLNFKSYGPELLKLIFQMEDPYIPIDIFSTPGTSTTSMIGMSGVMMWLTNYSEFATGLAFSFLAFTGQICIYAVMRPQFPEAYRKRIAFATLFLPSVVYWSGGVVKEAVALGGLGWMMLGFSLFVAHRQRGWGLLLMGGGAVIVSISKAYILFPFAVGAAAWFYWDKSLKNTGRVAIVSKPFHMIGALILGLGGMILLGELFPMYSVENFAEEASRLQDVGSRNESAGSTYQMGDGETTTLTGQLLFAPMALMAALFRPFIFEAHNVMALINGLETFVVTLLFIQVLRTRGPRQTFQLLVSSPFLIFCIIFVLLFGLGVGLTTTNLGTLSRYRIPMMPMYVGLLLMLLPLKRPKR